MINVKNFPFSQKMRSILEVSWVLNLNGKFREACKISSRHSLY